jgi:hypothetical protein
MAARTTNTPRHDVTCSNSAPSTGAPIGATPLTISNSAKYRAAVTPE